MRNAKRLAFKALLTLNAIFTFAVLGLPHAFANQEDSGPDFSVHGTIKRIHITSVGIVVLLSIFLVLFWIVYSLWRRQNRKFTSEQSHPSQSPNR